MTEMDEYILVDSAEVGRELPALLKAVEERGRTVRIVRDGHPVAELKPVRPSCALPPEDPQLKVSFGPDYDPVAGLDEQDWPEHLR